MTDANRGGRNGRRFQNKSLVFGGLFKEGITTRSGTISYTFFLLSFFNKYKLLGHCNASTALDVCKLHLYKAMCVCLCVCSTKSYVAVVQERKKNTGVEGVGGSPMAVLALTCGLCFSRLTPRPQKQKIIIFFF